MCLGIPGKIKEVFSKGDIRMSLVDFEGVELEVCLEAVPEAVVGDYVIVHAGFAISLLSETEAKETLDMLAQINALSTDDESSGK
jgi:hydrogenase expression/formation protein HypC